MLKGVKQKTCKVFQKRQKGRKMTTNQKPKNKKSKSKSLKSKRKQSIQKKTTMYGGGVIRIEEDKEYYEGYKDEDDKPHGEGKYKWEDGSVYTGDWVNGKRDGKGKMMFANGRVYEGHWKDDKLDGKGRFTWRCGDFYDGEMKENELHGEGILKFPDGDYQKGTFKNDKLYNGFYKQKNIRPDYILIEHYENGEVIDKEELNINRTYVREIHF